MLEAYYCTFLVYGLYVNKNIKTALIALLLELPVCGRVFGFW